MRHYNSIADCYAAGWAFSLSLSSPLFTCSWAIAVILDVIVASQCTPEADFAEFQGHKQNEIYIFVMTMCWQPGVNTVHCLWSNGKNDVTRYQWAVRFGCVHTIVIYTICRNRCLSLTTGYSILFGAGAVVLMSFGANLWLKRAPEREPGPVQWCWYCPDV